MIDSEKLEKLRKKSWWIKTKHSTERLRERLDLMTCSNIARLLHALCMNGVLVSGQFGNEFAIECELDFQKGTKYYIVCCLVPDRKIKNKEAVLVKTFLTEDQFFANIQSNTFHKQNGRNIYA